MSKTHKTRNRIRDIQYFRAGLAKALPRNSIMILVLALAEEDGGGDSAEHKDVPSQLAW